MTRTRLWPRSCPVPTVGEHVQFGVGDGPHRNQRHVKRAHPVVAAPRQNVGAATLCIFAHGIGASDALITDIICANAALPYIRRAMSSVRGSVASAQRSSMSSLGHQRRVVDHRFAASRPAAGGRVLGELLQESDALTGPRLKMFVPIPPMVTRRRTLAGW